MQNERTMQQQIQALDMQVKLLQEVTEEHVKKEQAMSDVIRVQDEQLQIQAEEAKKRERKKLWIGVGGGFVAGAVLVLIL
jgi:propanediol dehydratase small subunit